MVTYNLLITTEHPDHAHFAHEVAEKVANVFGFDGLFETDVTLLDSDGNVIVVYNVEAGEAT